MWTRKAAVGLIDPHLTALGRAGETLRGPFLCPRLGHTQGPRMVHGRWPRQCPLGSARAVVGRVAGHWRGMGSARPVPAFYAPLSLHLVAGPVPACLYPADRTAGPRWASLAPDRLGHIAAIMAAIWLKLKNIFRLEPRSFFVLYQFFFFLREFSKNWQYGSHLAGKRNAPR